MTECFWHFQFALSGSVICSQAGFSEGETSPGLKTQPAKKKKEAQYYSFCPTEWQRQAEYLPINLTRCRSGCWLSINRVYLVCARKPSPFLTTELLVYLTPHIILTGSPHEHSTWNLNYEVYFKVAVKCWKHNISTCLCQIYHDTLVLLEQTDITGAAASTNYDWITQKTKRRRCYLTLLTVTYCWSVCICLIFDLRIIFVHLYLISVCTVVRNRPCFV